MELQIVIGHIMTTSRNLFFFTHACKTLVCAPFTDSENGLFPHQCTKNGPRAQSVLLERNML